MTAISDHASGSPQGLNLMVAASTIERTFCETRNVIDWKRACNLSEKRVREAHEIRKVWELKVYD